MLPSVSIIVPVYNVEPYIHRCIDSILVQTFTDFECILVDDCSPDNCPAICDEYARKDSRIKVIHKIRNEGLPFARKTGYENSSGVYIQHIDSDDYVEPDMIESLYTYALTKDYDMVCHDWYEHRHEVFIKKMPPVSNDFVENIKNIILDIGLKGAVWNKFVKRSVYENIEFPKDGFHEDKYISTQTLYFSKEIGYLNSPFYHYMINNNSWVRDPKREWGRTIGEVNNFLKVIDFIKKHYDGGGGGGLDVFEPELSRRILQIKEKRLIFSKNILKKVLRIIVPVKAWRKWLRKVFLVLRTFIWHVLKNVV